MMRRAALRASEFVTTLLVAVLATVLLLILSATTAVSQTIGSQTIGSQTIRSQSGTSRLNSAQPDSAQPPKGTARMTWPRATRALLRGEVVNASDFVLADTVITWTWKVASADTMTAVAGWVTRRPIAQGEFMHGPSIAPASVITLGSSVKALWQDGNVRLTLTGTATNNAALGAPVGVRIDKDRRLDGIAVGPNIVRLR